MRLPTVRNGLLLAVTLAGVMLAGPSSASAQASSEEAQGSQLLQAVQQGDKSCSQLSDGDFEVMGEAWMGQVLGSTEAHDAMNNLMASMMGSNGEEQMHQFMGRRSSGCGGGTAPAGFAAMMGRMGLMGAYQGGAGMMGGQSGYSSGGHYGNDDGPSAAAMIGMMAVLIGAVALALAIFKPWRHSQSSRSVLDRRFASGELSAEEYRQAKSLLEGGSR